MVESCTYETITGFLESTCNKTNASFRCASEKFLFAYRAVRVSSASQINSGVRKSSAISVNEYLHMPPECACFQKCLKSEKSKLAILCDSVYPAVSWNS